MATKNLARTVVEGGRPKSNGIFRREATRAERHSVAALLHRSCTDLELYDETALPLRKPQYKEFADKLAPARRWLMSQVGRNWDRVRSELTRRYDRRTTKARNLLDDHLLSDVEPMKYVPRNPDFFVGPDGVLTRGEPRRRHRWYGHDDVPKTVTNDDLHAWLSGRKVGSRGQHLYWFVPTFTTIDNIAGAYRQGRELNPEDVAFFRKLTIHQRKAAMIPKEE